MIRKLLQLGAPKEAVGRMLADYETWPQWMAGFEEVRVVERSGDGRTRIEAVQRHLGQKLVQVLDCHATPGSVRQRQVEGRFRSWQALWRYFDAPSGGGTVLEVQIEMDLGLLGLLVPKRQIHRALDDSFERTAVRAKERARELARRAHVATSAPDAEAVTRALLRGPLDPRHMVLEIEGRRYRLEPVQSPETPR